MLVETVTGASELGELVKLWKNSELKVVTGTVALSTTKVDSVTTLTVSLVIGVKVTVGTMGGVVTVDDTSTILTDLVLDVTKTEEGGVEIELELLESTVVISNIEAFVETNGLVTKVTVDVEVEN